MRRPPFFLLPSFLLAAVGVLGGPVSSGAEVPTDLEAQSTFFESHIRPLLVERCYECHASDTKRKGGLLLDSKAGWMIGGDSGPALIPGDPEGSLLMHAVGYEEPDLQMPPKKKLSEMELSHLREWIRQGAYDPREAVEGSEPLRPEEGIDVEARRQAHWAWQPVSSPEAPAVTDESWPRQTMDRFLLAKLEDAGLAPHPPAGPEVLVRRVFFDLIGLPPSPQQVRDFAQTPSEDAYVALVDELLGSPHFGERWGQHWLDIVRFAETWGHEQDFPIPEAWRYRDYVVRAFNADVPYDELLREHVAGDLMDPPRIDPERRTNESIQGTGFWHLGEATHSPVDIRDDECIRVSNQIDVFSKAFMGLTVACARCHDHKFDAITDEDYYALFGYLQSSSFQLADVSDPEAQARAVEDLTGLRAEEERELKRALRREYALLRTAGPVDWTAHLTETSRQPEHPLFPLAVAADAQATAEGEPEEGSFDEVRQAILRRWLEEEETRRVAHTAETVVRTEKQGELDLMPVEEPFDPERHVVVDYAAEAPAWYVSGHRFGEGPLEPGTLLVARTSETPTFDLVVERAAHGDGVSEKFTGLLRTQTFEIVGDRLWYRFRGEGRVFLEVDSHRVCQGPLHSGALKMDLKGKGNYRWASHDVSKYIGHRAHVEFTAMEGFSVSEVRFSRERPVELFVANPHLRAVVEHPGVDSRVSLNAGLNRLFDRAVSAWEEGSCQDPELLRLARWVLLRSGLVDLEASERVGDVASGFGEARRRIEDTIPGPILALAMLDGSGENEPVHVRGNYRTLSPDPVPRRPLQALLPTEEDAFAEPPENGSGRLQLARHLTSPENPLTARVMVNRLWHHLFGRGLVETVDNFGSTGAAPSHPLLLDHLSRRFMDEHGWSIKGLLREMVTSSAYRMSSHPDPDKEAVDAGNRLWHRMPIRRLTSEAIRDHLLAVSGRLDDRVYGESVMVHISDFMRSNRSPSGSGPLDGDGRRSLYIEGRRNHMEPLLVAFDKPTPFTAIGRRNVSNSPAQPLMLLNNELVHQQAGLWARRLLQSEHADEASRLRAAYWTAFSRAPEPWESEMALNFLEEQKELHAGDEDPAWRAWKDLAHTLINVKEFIFIN